VLPRTTLRAGVGIETSPVRESLGWVGLPGADSRSLSAGLSHKLTEYLTFDLAYSYTWRDTQQIVVGPGHPDQAKFITIIPGIFNSWGGTTDGHSQVVSAARSATDLRTQGDRRQAGTVTEGARASSSSSMRIVTRKTNAFRAADKFST